MQNRHESSGATDAIGNRLQTAIDQMRKDMERVEIWSAALVAFLQPVPEMAPRNDNLLPADSEPPAGGERERAFSSSQR